MEDSWSWLGDKGGKFSMEDMYEALSVDLHMETIILFSWKKLRWKAVPSKVSAFSWKAVRDRISSKENLLKRGLTDDIGTGMCSLCFSDVESSTVYLPFGNSVVV